MSRLQVLMPADVRFPLERANGVQIVKTATALARSGVETTLVVRQSDPRPTSEILALFGEGHEARLTVRRLETFHRRGSYFLPRLLFLARATAIAWARGLAGSILLTRDLQLAEILVRLRVPRLVYEAHAVEALMYRERGSLYGSGELPSPRKATRLARRERLVWRRARGFVTTTAGIRDCFSGSYGARETRVIPNGCDVPEGRSFTVPPDSRRIVYAGQLYPWKGVDVLIEAVTRVPEARLVILGGIEGEGDLARVRALVAERGLAERTELLGGVPQARVANELSRANVVAVPFLRTAMTERHTSPIKAFEAMAAGRPIVASDLPSSREVLRDGENALLVAPGDAEALAAALRRVLEDRELAERLARNAFSEAPTYSWDARAQKLRELIEELR